MDLEERKLRKNEPGVFEQDAGHFWRIRETRPYMLARLEHVHKMLLYSTYEAVETALGHLMDMHRLCPGDNMGLRDHYAAFGSSLIIMNLSACGNQPRSMSCPDAGLAFPTSYTHEQIATLG